MLDELNHWPLQSLSSALTEPQRDQGIRQERHQLIVPADGQNQAQDVESKEQKELETRKGVLQMRDNAEGQREMLRGIR